MIPAACPVYECGARVVRLVSYDAVVCLGPVGHVLTGQQLHHGGHRPVLEVRAPVRRIVAWTTPRWCGWTVPEGTMLPDELVNWQLAAP